MDEPQPTQNLFRPQAEAEQQTQQMYPPVPPTMVVPPSGPPPEWSAPIWKRRGALVGAGLLVLVVAGLIVGIVLAIPSPPTPANTAASLPAASTVPTDEPTSSQPRRGPRLGPGERLVQGTIGSVTGDQVVVTPNRGGADVTVTTDGSTKFGGGATSITDLKPGEHVQVIVRNGTAVAIRARKLATTG